MFIQRLWKNEGTFGNYPDFQGSLGCTEKGASKWSSTFPLRNSHFHACKDTTMELNIKLLNSACCQTWDARVIEDTKMGSLSGTPRLWVSKHALNYYLISSTTGKTPKVYLQYQRGKSHQVIRYNKTNKNGWLRYLKIDSSFEALYSTWDDVVSRD